MKLVSALSGCHLVAKCRVWRAARSYRADLRHIAPNTHYLEVASSRHELAIDVAGVHLLEGFVSLMAGNSGVKRSRRNREMCFRVLQWNCAITMAVLCRIYIRLSGELYADSHDRK